MQTPAPDRLLSSVRREHGFEPLRVEGAIPTELAGTLYRVGPGLFEAQGRAYEHPFEGDGAVCGVRLQGGKASGAHRVVRSVGLQEEREAGRALYGTVASWPRRLLNGMRMRMKNAANTNVMVWQEKLYALHEMSRATELTDDLHTVGETDFGGAAPVAFSAHYHRVASQDVIYNFGVRYGPKTELDIFRLPATGAATCIATVRLPTPVMLHDFIATERYLVFFVSPSVLQVGRALLGLNPFTKLIQWEPRRGTEVIVVPVHDPQQVTRFSVDSFYQWHFGNAFEQGGELFVDLVKYADLGTFDELSDGIRQLEGGTLTRARVDIQGHKLHFEQLDDLGSEFPRMDPRFEGAPYTKTWLFQGETLSQHNLSTGKRQIHNFGEGQFVSEPVFVPRSDDAPEGDGWVLSLIYDKASAESYVAILDTNRFDDEPVAKIWFDHHVPVTFHGVWHPNKS